MSDIPVVVSCPLGSKCEEIKDGAIHRCAWYIQMEGVNPQNGQTFNKKDCAIAWQPLLSIEMARTNQGQTAALESFRNEMVKGNQQMTKALLHAAESAEERSERLING